MRNQSGVTMMELMIVIAIIGIISAGVVPNLISWRNNAQLSSGARQLYSDLQGARRAAIKHNSTATVDFSFGTANEYEIAVPGALNYPQNKQMPPGINIDSVAFTSLVDIASFNNMGFGRTAANLPNNGTINISKAGGAGRTSTITIGSGGSIRIQ